MRAAAHSWAAALAAGLLLAGRAACGPAVAQPVSVAPRSEVPIREVVLSDGARRYSVPIKVGAAVIEAGLDTGSVGLRILARALADNDVNATAEADSYSYGSGAKLDGLVGEAGLTLGGSSGPVRVQIVQRVGCRPDVPDCPAAQVAPAQYGIQGDGLPGEGFAAILGANMGIAEIPNPLVGLAVRRWIIELPRPGDVAPGRLILNPTGAEQAGFIMLPLAAGAQRGGLHDAVAGCIVNEANKARACGLLMMDTGAPGIVVANGGLGSRPWPGGVAATLSFSDGAGRLRASERLTIGLRTHASRLTFRDMPRLAQTAIFAGLSPYFVFSVLYDPEHGLIGLKARPPMSGGPAADMGGQSN